MDWVEGSNYWRTNGAWWYCTPTILLHVVEESPSTYTVYNSGGREYGKDLLAGPFDTLEAAKAAAELIYGEREMALSGYWNKDFGYLNPGSNGWKATDGIVDGQVVDVWRMNNGSYELRKCRPPCPLVAGPFESLEAALAAAGLMTER